MGDEEKLVCLLCLKMMVADSMKPNKLKRYLNSLYLIHAEKPFEFFFQRKLAEYWQQSFLFGTARNVN